MTRAAKPRAQAAETQTVNIFTMRLDGPPPGLHWPKLRQRGEKPVARLCRGRAQHAGGHPQMLLHRRQVQRRLLHLTQNLQQEHQTTRVLNHCP